MNLKSQISTLEIKYRNIFVNLLQKKSCEKINYDREEGF